LVVAELGEDLLKAELVQAPLESLVDLAEDLLI
jgi:hypothetical protein